ncbi:hypothetical protein DC498_10945 [Terrimonas sp.]|uniref:hypothetical protein n=1 Tax=Terrimonas sp. TaxID=1914338 RepID=UPI000D515C8B|nr:hypothetical protein [Terrimonas sp.]PVD52232.1 hypothetical protein DC498_10945 [Terrimonas sp.]
MNRRNFIRLTGTSTSALLLSQYAKANEETGTKIQLPDSISILQGSEYIPMQSLSSQRWIYQDIVVELKAAKKVMEVFIQAPKSSLEEIRISWNFSTSAEAKILGDTWERSYADLGFQSVSSTGKMPWYCIEYSRKGTNCFGVKTGCNVFGAWQVESGNLHLHLDTRNGGMGVLLGDRTLHAVDIVTATGRAHETVYATARRFCKLMCDKPLTVKQPVYGINDWYFAYGNNSAKLILEHTALLSPLAVNTSNRPFSVIDDGWQLGTDFGKTNEKFGDMSKLVADIRQLGMRPGLWTRPLLAKSGTNSKLFIKDRGEILDPTLDENINYIQQLFRLYKVWGFDLVKHDYTTFDIFGRWGKEMSQSITQSGWQFNDRSKTNAEILLNLYQAIRKASPDMYLIGCNTISHLSAGVFEIYRTGDDTSGKEWIRTKEMGVNTMGFRMLQHRTFYETDGDCVGLTTAVPWEKNKQWMQLLAQSSTPLFISAQPEAVGVEQKDFIKQSFTDASRHLPVAEPLDWLENQFPAKWKLDKKIITFDWN